MDGDFLLRSCPAGKNDKCCKHVGAVSMYREAEEQWEQAHNLAVTVGVHEPMERSIEKKLADLY